MPVSLEAMVSAGGVSEVVNEDEEYIDGMQIDCTVIGEFPMV